MRKLFLLGLSAAALCSCGRPREPQRLSLALQSWVGYGPLYLAQDKGFFKEEGLELLFVKEELDPARRDAFQQGLLDCEAGTLDLLVSKRAQGAPIVAVTGMAESFGGDGIVAAEGIGSLSGLRGKRVALTSGDVNDTFLSAVFLKERLSRASLRLVDRPPDQVAEAFLKHEADAAVTWEPWLSRALQRPGSRLLKSSRDYPGIIVDTLNVREDVLRDQPHLVRGLLRGWFKAVDFVREHPEEASRVMAPHYGLTPEQYRQAADGLRWTSYAQASRPEQARAWRDTFAAIADIKLQAKAIAAKPDARQAIDPSALGRLHEAHP